MRSVILCPEFVFLNKFGEKYSGVIIANHILSVVGKILRALIAMDLNALLSNQLMDQL